MKKYFLIVFCALLLFVVTGCGKNEMKCTGSMTEGGQKVSAEMIAEFDSSDKLVDATVVEDLGSSDLADQYCKSFEMFASSLPDGISVSCSGSKVTIKGFAKLADMDEEDEEEKMIGITKEEFKSKMESETEGKFTCQ